MIKLLLLFKHITQYLACGFLFVGALPSSSKTKAGSWEVVMVAFIQTILTMVLGEHFPTTFLGSLLTLVAGLYYYWRGREKLIVTLLLSLNVYALSLYLNMFLGCVSYAVITLGTGQEHRLLTGLCNILLFVGTSAFLVYRLSKKKQERPIGMGFYSLSILCGIVLICNIAIVLPNYMSRTRFEWFFSLIALVTVAVILVGTHESCCEQENRTKLQGHIRELSGQVHHFKEFFPALSRLCNEQLRIIYSKEKGMDAAKELLPLTKNLKEICEGQIEESRREFLSAAPKIKTGLVLLDAMLEDYQERMKQRNILFQVKVHTSPAKLIRKKEISQLKLMELLGDVLTNAMRAIERKEQKEEETVELDMGISPESGFYEIDIYDSGVPFEERILREFGHRGLTTGGTGEGLANMLDTLRKYHISLAITEYPPDEEFSKCLNFCFAGDFEVAYYGKQKDSFHLYPEKQHHITH